MGEYGLMGILVLEWYGGVGVDVVFYILVIYEILKISVVVGVIFFVYILVGINLILYFGNEE